MAINLSEPPAAMIQYLLTKVDIYITLENLSGGGPPINTGDTFTIRMTGTVDSLARLVRAPDAWTVNPPGS